MLEDEEQWNPVRLDNFAHQSNEYVAGHFAEPETRLGNRTKYQWRAEGRGGMSGRGENDQGPERLRKETDGVGTSRFFFPGLKKIEHFKSGDREIGSEEPKLPWVLVVPVVICSDYGGRSQDRLEHFLPSQTVRVYVVASAPALGSRFETGMEETIRGLSLCCVWSHAEGCSGLPGWGNLVRQKRQALCYFEMHGPMTIAMISRRIQTRPWRVDHCHKGN